VPYDSVYQATSDSVSPTVSLSTRWQSPPGNTWQYLCECIFLTVSVYPDYAQTWAGPDETWLSGLKKPLQLTCSSGMESL